MSPFEFLLCVLKRRALQSLLLDNKTVHCGSQQCLYTWVILQTAGQFLQLAGQFTYMDRCHTVTGNSRVSLLTRWTTICVVQTKGFLMNLSLPICWIHDHVYKGIKYYQNHNFQSHAAETLKTPWTLRTQDIDNSIAVTHRTQLPLITLA